MQFFEAPNLRRGWSTRTSNYRQCRLGAARCDFPMKDSLRDRAAGSICADRHGKASEGANLYFNHFFPNFWISWINFVISFLLKKVRSKNAVYGHAVLHNTAFDMLACRWWCSIFLNEKEDFAVSRKKQIVESCGTGDRAPKFSTQQKTQREVCGQVKKMRVGELSGKRQKLPRLSGTRHIWHL